MISTEQFASVLKIEKEVTNSRLNKISTLCMLLEASLSLSLHLLVYLQYLVSFATSSSFSVCPSVATYLE